MNITGIFSTIERVRLLKHIIYKKERLNVSKIAKELKLSKGFVSTTFKILEKERILKAKGKGAVVQENLKTKAIKIWINLSNFDQEILKKYKFVESAGLYGSFVKGTNTEDSDMDLWVLVSKAKEEEFARLTSELKKRYGRIKPLYLTRDKLNALKQEDSVFYHSLIFGSIIVYGEKNEEI